jgi:cytochrome c oxidase assembly protein subunit 15
MEVKAYTRVALVAWLFQALIVFSGAAVRLTDAGLGCEDWPTCNDGELFPEWQVHGLIEFGNRVISGFVAVSAVVALVGAYRRVPRRSDLIRYAWLIVAGTIAQVVLGGITVLLDLHPVVVSVHFLLSMALLVAAQLLWFHSRSEYPADDGAVPAGTESAEDGGVSTLIKAQLGLATVVLLTGTVVTGTGPNGGDTRADRLSFDLETVARFHSASVWLLLATLVVLAIRLASRQARSADRRSTTAERFQLEPFTVVRWMLVVAVIQGGIGYTQFSLGVPPLLVELHIIGAVAVWTLALLLVMVSGAPPANGDANPGVRGGVGVGVEAEGKAARNRSKLTQ